MAKTSKMKVVEAFHLPLDQAKDLFKDIEAYDQNVIVIGLHPPKRSSISDVKSQVEIERQKLARKGFQIISIGKGVKTELKEGDTISMSDQSGVLDAITREIIVKDVFPSLRKYTAMILPAHFITHFVKKPNELNSSEKSVDMDYILSEITRYKKELEK